MCWQCDHPDKTLNDYLSLLRERILHRGWVVQYVEDDRRPFAYTIGLHDHGLPELLVTGLPPKRALWLLNTFAKRALAGGRSTPGDQVSLPAGTRLELVEVEHPDAHMGIAVAIDGPGLTAVQLVWADGRGRWPWAPGFDDGRRCQPVLGVRRQNA
ncbi:DUF4262 domain-containing protein [Mycolicibacterium sp.]|uniref:DUF4262 domain-containing protein n=1 Tax=Mycolicibacterium sp. TaxID=2320850 RepID=UPI001A2B85F6|nr:DUF4262 domain-containing protein [Mycolicibacterium sp.]MBJ7339836.1 DUF4262 domain-containing protein [Mycolicibacterium sp.]